MQILENRGKQRRNRPLAAVALAASLLCRWPFDADTARAEAASQAPAEVVVATKEAPPFAMKSADGQWNGIAIELWTRIADKLGMHTTFHELGIPFIAPLPGIRWNPVLDDGVVGRGSNGEGLLGEAMKAQPAGL